MGAAMAGWTGDVVLHADTRSPPSRAGVHAGTSDGVSIAERGGIRDVELGEAVEGWRRISRPRSRILIAGNQVSAAVCFSRIHFRELHRKAGGILAHYRKAPAFHIRLSNSRDRTKMEGEV